MTFVKDVHDGLQRYGYNIYPMLTNLILTRDDCLYNRLVPARTRSLRTRIVNEHVCGWPTAGEQPHGNIYKPDHVIWRLDFEQVDYGLSNTHVFTNLFID